VVNPFRANVTRRFNPSTRETALKPRDTASSRTKYAVHCIPCFTLIIDDDEWKNNERWRKDQCSL